MKRRRLVLRNVRRCDEKDIWLWRNSRKARGNFFKAKKISWQEHLAWFKSVLTSTNTKIYIAHRGGSKIGVVRFNILKNKVNVSINLNPDYVGKGFGARVIKMGSTKIRPIIVAKPIVAEIKKNNAASRKAFLTAGYKYAGQNRKAAIYVMAAQKKKAI